MKVEMEEDDPMNQEQMPSPIEDTDEGTMDTDDRVEYAVLLPDSFAILD